MWIIITIAVIAILIFALKNTEATNNAALKEQGYEPGNFMEAGKYLSGHVMIDQPKEMVYIYPDANSFKIFGYNKGTAQKDYMAEIEISKIKDITFEDESSIQTRVGLKRMLAIGLFAFAVKKKEKMQVAYVVIEWTEAQFTHETVFEFEGSAAISRANTLRNKLIRFMTIGTNSELDDKIKELISQGKTLNAVKHYHDVTGATLKQSKDYVDNIISKM